jgi:choline transporter-like protein 2/4/5
MLHRCFASTHRFLRTVLSYIESKLKAFNNDLVRCLLCVCKCCLWCLEKFMRFINRNAYIVCAMRSTNFCVSAKDAFSLLMRNILRVVVLNKVLLMFKSGVLIKDDQIIIYLSF